MSKIITNQISPRSGDTITVNGGLSIGGTITYEDVTNVDSVGIVTAGGGVIASGIGVSVASGGVRVTGVVTATTFIGAVTGDVTGNLTGDVTGNLTGDVTGDVTGNITGVVTATTFNGNSLVVSGNSTFSGGLIEKYENAGTTLGAQTNNPLSDGNVILFTGNESGNLTINFTGVHATLSNGETVSFTAILTPNNSGVINVVQVDGQAITIKWSGGSAPSAGASGQDIYTFQILKTGTGTSDYTVFGAAANYA
jgi:hypothetical protein